MKALTIIMKVMTLITMKMILEVGDDGGYSVMKVKEVMTCDVLPVTMFMGNAQMCFGLHHALLLVCQWQNAPSYISMMGR